jgi:hypothetical protein
MQINLYNRYRKYFILLFAGIVLITSAYCKTRNQAFFQIKIYQLKNNDQVNAVDSFLKYAYLPALHRAGILKVGVFIPIANDTSAIKKIYVFIPFHSIDEWQKFSEKLNKDSDYTYKGKNFIEALSNHPPFERSESILLEAMPVVPNYILPDSKSSTRVFELRDYESPTEHLLSKKLQMFNEGGETEIFKRLNFNPVFYAKVISGSRMPDLMYMTSFENVEARDAHWKQFGEDSKWKEISTDPKYENKVSVSHIESILMRSTSYSDF